MSLDKEFQADFLKRFPKGVVWAISVETDHDFYGQVRFLDDEGGRVLLFYGYAKNYQFTIEDVVSDNEKQLVVKTTGDKWIFRQVPEEDRKDTLDGMRKAGML